MSDNNLLMLALLGERRKLAIRMKNKKFIVIIILLLSVIFIIPFVLEYFIFQNDVYSVLSNGEWSSFLGSYIGGVLGGIGTLLSVYFTTKETRRIQKENSTMIEEQKDVIAKRDRKQFTDGIVQDVAKYITDISKYFYDCSARENLDINNEQLNKELRSLSDNIRQKLEQEKGMDISGQTKEYIRIDREIEQLKQKEQELKYRIKENTRKMERNKADRTIAIECYFLLRMKLKGIEEGKEVIEQLEHIHNNSTNIWKTDIDFINEETNKLLDVTGKFVETYVS